MSFLDNIYNKPPATPSIGEVNFIVYTMDVLNDPSYILADGNAAELEEEQISEEVVAAAFQGITNFGMKQQSNVPYEPLELGQFSSDSIGGTPFEIAIVAEVAPAFSKSLTTELNITSDADRREYIGDVEDMMNESLTNEKQMVLLFKTPLFKSYINLKLVEFMYDITPDNRNMTAFMKFQQIRITKSEYAYVPVDSVTGPNNASQKSNGATQPQVPSATITELATA